MSDGILGGIGKKPDELVKPVADVAKKAAKTQAIKSIKLKVKFKDKKPNGT